MLCEHYFFIMSTIECTIILGKIRRFFFFYLHWFGHSITLHKSCHKEKKMFFSRSLARTSSGLGINNKRKLCDVTTSNDNGSGIKVTTYCYRGSFHLKDIDLFRTGSVIFAYNLLQWRNNCSCFLRGKILNIITVVPQFDPLN